MVGDPGRAQGPALAQGPSTVDTGGSPFSELKPCPLALVGQPLNPPETETQPAGETPRAAKSWT